MLWIGKAAGCRTFLIVGISLALSACGGSGAPEDSKSRQNEPPPSKNEPLPAPSFKTGTVVGEVKFVGAAPTPMVFKVNKDNQVCGNEKKSEELLVGANGGVKNAVVSLVGAKGSGSKSSAKPILDQKGCQFQPHVLVIPAGSEVDILNPDGVLHNIHTFSTLNPPVNKAQPKFKKVMSEKFDTPEIIRVQCDAHSWMSGWIVVSEHPYYEVTNEQGAFRIEGVSQGIWTISMWHEKLGTLETKITVKAGEVSKVLFEIKMRALP